MTDAVVFLAMASLFCYRLWVGWTRALEIVQFGLAAIAVGLQTVLGGPGKAVLAGLITTAAYWVFRHAAHERSVTGTRTTIVTLAGAASATLLSLLLDIGADGLVTAILLSVTGLLGIVLVISLQADRRVLPPDLNTEGEVDQS